MGEKRVIHIHRYIYRIEQKLEMESPYAVLLIALREMVDGPESRHDGDNYSTDGLKPACLSIH